MDDIETYSLYTNIRMQLVKLRIIFFIACLIFPASSAFALRMIPITLDHFEDKSSALSIEEVLAKEDTLPWKTLPTLNPHFGYSASRHWVRFRISEAELKYGSNEPLLLEVPFTYMARISLFYTVGGKVLRSSFSGQAVPTSERVTDVLPSGAPVFRIPAPRSPDAKYFISIESTFPLALPINLIEAPDFGYHYWKVGFAVGMFLGLLTLAALFNGFLAASLRSRMYFYYSFFVAFLTMLFMAHEGLSVQFFWPESPWWALREAHVWGGLALLFYALFVREFLQSHKVTPVLNRILFWLVGISTVRTVWMLFSLNQIVAMIGELAVTSTNFLVLVISGVALYRKVRTAKYFFISSLAFNTSFFLYVAQTANVIWLGNFLQYAPHVGSAMEVIFLSLALADRIRQTNRDLAAHRSAMTLADKLGALGRMAGEVAHEINNPLAIIHANAVMIKEYAEKIPDQGFNLAGLASTIENTATRISKVVKGMSVLTRDSRRDPLLPAPLSGIIQDSVALCQERYDKNLASLQVSNTQPSLIIQCRSSEICQVIVNLLTNSLDAVKDEYEKWVRLDMRVKRGFLEIAVEDSGLGIPKDVRKRIMEPFFTTKEPGKGVGLGLSISRTIVENHGGKLWLDEGSGNTRFVFTIPLETDHE